MVKESISKNIEKGALQSNYSQKFPNLESGLSLYYAASLEGKHELANKAYATAYKEKVPDKQTSDLQKVSAPVYPSGSNTPTPFSTSSNQQTPLYNPSPSFQPNLSNYYAPLSQNKYPRFKDMTEEDITLYAESLFKNGENDKEPENAKIELTDHTENFLNDFYGENIKDRFRDSIKNSKNYATEKPEEKKDKDISALEIIEVAADVLTLVPGVDTFANAVSLVINVIQGDWDEAALSAVGMVPILGEFADAAKTAKVTAKVIDKVHDASKLTKFADKTLDIIKNPKFIEHTGKIGECITNAIITGSVYANDGKSFGVGFASELVSSLVSEYIPVPTKKAHVETIIKESIGSALGAVVDGFINGDDIEALTNSVVKSAAKGIVVGLGVDYLETAIKLANEAGSVAREFSKYDEKFGKALEFFFKRLITAMSATEIKNEN